MQAVARGRQMWPDVALSCGYGGWVWPGMANICRRRLPVKRCDGSQQQDHHGQVLWGDQGTAYVGTHPAPEEGPPVPAWCAPGSASRERGWSSWPGTGIAAKRQGRIMLESVFEYLLPPVLSSPERDRGGGSDEQHNRRRDARPALPCAHPPAGGHPAVRAGLRALRPVHA